MMLLLPAVKWILIGLGVLAGIAVVIVVLAVMTLARGEQ